MKRFAVILGVLVLGILVGSARRSFAPEQDLCAGFTITRMLDDPELARLYFGALHDGDPRAREQLDAMVGQLRAAHGCGATGENASQDTFAHPPGAPRLPPGHPPIDGSPRTPIFEAEPGSTLTI
jgi:hypothetical protein